MPHKPYAAELDQAGRFLAETFGPFRHPPAGPWNLSPTPRARRVRPSLPQWARHLIAFAAGVAVAYIALRAGL